MVSRRNTLIAVGTLAAGAGVISSTGAFTSVDADRSVSVTTQGDGSGLVGMSAANARAEQYVTTTDGTVEIDLSGGLNIGAVSVFNPLITVVNNSQNDMDLGLELTGDADMVNYVSFMVNGTEANPVLPDGTVSIPSGGTQNFGLKFDIPKSADLETLNMTLVVTAKGK